MSALSRFNSLATMMNVTLFSNFQDYHDKMSITVIDMAKLLLQLSTIPSVRPII